MNSYIKFVGIKLVLPLVTTLSIINTFTELIILYSSHRAVTVSTGWLKAYEDMQCQPTRTVLTEHSSVYRALQYLPSTVQRIMVTELHRQYTVFTEFSTVSIVHRVILLLPSLQWLPSSELLRVVSMDRAFTSTECMTMSCNAVDAEYQKVTESVHWTRVIYCWADFVKGFSLMFLADLTKIFVIKKVYIMNVL